MTVHSRVIVDRRRAGEVGVSVRPAADLRTGHAVLFERCADTPFAVAPARGEDWQRTGHRFAGLLWAQVADLEPLPGGHRGEKSSVYSIALYFEFTATESLAITVASDALVVVQPR
ncbi:hypothetical protein [Streptosporangium sp. NPDC049046]|uniref:hypothetical protein n=1 Tax=Streptosporangium sp. NPDC049046 TaxID=3155031 RepID=UPI003439375E